MPKYFGFYVGFSEKFISTYGKQARFSSIFCVFNQFINQQFSSWKILSTLKTQQGGFDFPLQHSSTPQITFVDLSLDCMIYSSEVMTSFISQSNLTEITRISCLSKLFFCIAPSCMVSITFKLPFDSFSFVSNTRIAAFSKHCQHLLMRIFLWPLKT